MNSVQNGQTALIIIGVLLVAIFIASIIGTVLAKRVVEIETTASLYDIRDALITRQVLWKRCEGAGDVINFTRRKLTPFSDRTMMPVVSVAIIDQDPDDPLAPVSTQPDSVFIAIGLSLWSTRMGMIHPFDTLTTITMRSSIENRIRGLTTTTSIET